MNNHFEPLDNGEVLSISESALIYIGHTTFRVGEFSEAVRSQLEHNTEGWNDGKNSWFTDTGVDCEVLRFTSGGWQKGKVRLRLEFSPEDGSLSSPDQNATTQPDVRAGVGVPEAISLPDNVSTPTYTQLTKDSAAAPSFADAALPIAAVVGTAVVGGIALGYDDDYSSPEVSEEVSEETLEEVSEATSAVDEDFDLAPPTPEFELASLDDEDFDLDPPRADFPSSEESSPAESSPTDMDFDVDNSISQPETISLEDHDLDLESPNADLSALGMEDFSLEAADADFALENPLEDPLEDQGIATLEDAEFNLGTTDADLSDLGEDNFSLGIMEEEEANLEAPNFGLETSDFGLETSLVDQELPSLDDGDFSFESTAELELESLENTDLSSLGAEDFTEAPDTDLSSLESGDFALETPDADLSGFGDEEFNLGTNDSGFTASSDDEFNSLENNDFDLDNLETDFSGLENADFGSDAPESISFLESTETDNLENEFDLETPDFSSSVVEEPEEPDFGLDELLADDNSGDDLEFLSISEQDKQEFEQAAAAVSQAFDDDFGLELESTSKNGADIDSLELFALAGDDEVDAIERQLADALEDDLNLDLLGTSEGLTENLFADQDDALFKDVWEDINKSQVK